MQQQQRTITDSISDNETLHQLNYNLGLPHLGQLKKTGRPTAPKFCVPVLGALAPRGAKTAVLGVGAGGGHHLLQWGSVPGTTPPEKF